LKFEINSIKQTEDYLGWFSGKISEAIEGGMKVEGGTPLILLFGLFAILKALGLILAELRRKNETLR
jgi:hypothetical protein